ncbi:MmpS family transport accessory protein [Mycolicibacterium stellerae]|uniref:MmpS family transport accessory protein n=1 Tax=Mycolicibacterium stellerae TaxID=2358193 RepID=UPI000F0B7976|nr:MmpS family transport accessory protein [Mycolicibacterium stellerae]
MTNTPRGEGPDPTQPLGPSYPAYGDPAYAGQPPYPPTYQAPQAPDATRQLPPYSPYGYDQYSTGHYGTGQYGTGQYGTGQYGQPYPPGEPSEGPQKPKSPRWLWAAAGVAVLLVVGLVIALVVVNSSKQDTVVAPPPMPEPTTSTTRTPPTTSLRPLPPIVPVPTPSTTTTPPSESSTPGATESVIYEVTGTGRAINITYVDTGSLLQTEFNVVLPWRKEVELPSPAEDSASLTIINVGRQVSCSVTVNGVKVQSNTGNGLTICTALR